MGLGSYYQQGGDGPPAVYCSPGSHLCAQRLETGTDPGHGIYHRAFRYPGAECAGYHPVQFEMGGIPDTLHHRDHQHQQFVPEAIHGPVHPYQLFPGPVVWPGARNGICQYPAMDIGPGSKPRLVALWIQCGPGSRADRGGVKYSFAHAIDDRSIETEPAGMGHLSFGCRIQPGASNGLRTFTYKKEKK